MRKKWSVRELSIAGILVAVAVVGSLFSFPVFGSKCAPVQHVVNVMAAVLLGPVYGVSIAFLASLIRNLMALGSVLAFPGSMVGALVCALIYKRTRNIYLTVLGEMVGTGILGGLLAYPVAMGFFGKKVGSMAMTVYVVPFLISATVGAILGGIIFIAMDRTGALDRWKEGRD